MTCYVFDPSRLARLPKQQERDGYALAGRMLRDYLRGSPLADFRKRVRRDPKLRAMLAAAADDLRKAAGACEDRLHVQKSDQS